MRFDEKKKEYDLKVGDRVRIQRFGKKNKFSPKWVGPYVIHNINGSHLLLRDPKTGKIFGSNKNHVSRPIPEEKVMEIEENKLKNREWHHSRFLNENDEFREDLGNFSSSNQALNIPTHTSLYVYSENVDETIGMHVYTQANGVNEKQACTVSGIDQSKFKNNQSNRQRKPDIDKFQDSQYTYVDNSRVNKALKTYTRSRREIRQPLRYDREYIY